MRAEDRVRDFRYLESRRGNFESHWHEISQRVMPMDSESFLSRGNETKGSKRNIEVYDSTACIALNRFGAILDSLLTPRNQTWHRLKASEPALNKSKRVRLYFEEINQLLFKYRYAPKANFASQNQSRWKSLGAYGTGALWVDELKNEPGLRYRAIHLSEVYFAENHQGIIDKAYRRFKLTVRQAIQQFGQVVSDQVKQKAERQSEEEFDFLHCVYPREKVDISKKDYSGMPYESLYIELGTKKELKEEGYNTFPYAISRYEQALNEVYGRSPAMDVLPAIKTLNEEKKTFLTQGHRATNPVFLVHDDGIADAFSFTPGAMNAGGVSADGRPLVHTLPTGNYQIGKDMMDMERADINDAFLVSLFQILLETPQMTATEVMERTKEKGILLAPTVGRQQSESLGPQVERELDLLSRQGLLPALPPELVEAKGEYTVEYDSPLSRAQRAEEAAGLMRTVEMTLQVVNVTQNPALMDHYDFDVALPEIAHINGVPERWITAMEKIQAIREGRVEQQQQQQAIQAAPSLAALTKAQAVAQKSA